MSIGSISSWVRFTVVRLFSIALLTSLGAAARADGPPRPLDDPLFWSVPISLSTRCGPLGGCALFDDISLKIGTIGLVRGNGDSRFAAMSGLFHAAITFSDLAEIGGALGGHLTHDESGAFHGTTMPAIVYGRLRIYPWSWRKVFDAGGCSSGSLISAPSSRTSSALRSRPASRSIESACSPAGRSAPWIWTPA